MKNRGLKRLHRFPKVTERWSDSKDSIKRGFFLISGWSIKISYWSVLLKSNRGGVRHNWMQELKRCQDLASPYCSALPFRIISFTFSLQKVITRPTSSLLPKVPEGEGKKNMQLSQGSYLAQASLGLIDTESCEQSLINSSGWEIVMFWLAYSVSHVHSEPVRVNSIWNMEESRVRVVPEGKSFC